MKPKIFLIIAAICLICQIVFSFYYSTTTLSLNDHYNSIQGQLSQLKTDNELLDIKLSALTSLRNIESFATDNHFVPIKKHYAF